MARNQSNLANLISTARIFGVGFIFWITPYKTDYWQIACILIFTVIALTDFLDGWIARKYNIVSEMGKVLDPLADKILVLVFLPLLFMHAITAFPVFIILAREFAIMGLRVFSAKHGVIIPAGLPGKLKTAITFPTCAILMGRVPVEHVESLPVLFQPINWLAQWVYSWPSWVFDTLIWTMVVITVWSFVDYVVRFIWQRTLKKVDGNIEKAKKAVLVFIPNTLSLLNLLCGVFAIIYSVSGYVDRALFCVLLGAVLDAYDGKLARKFGVFSKWGEALDSKADFVTFGIAPSFIIFAILSKSTLPFGWIVGLLLGIGFYASVHFRLNRFNDKGHSDYLDGLPSPAGATMIAFASVSAIGSQIWIFIPVSIITSLLMISTFSYPHNRISHQKVIFRFVPPLAITCWLLTFALLLGAPFPSNWPIIDMAWGFTAVYLITPWLPLRKKFKS